MNRCVLYLFLHPQVRALWSPRLKCCYFGWAIASDTAREKQCGSECQQKVWPFIVPDVFNGDLSVNWDEWIDHLESAAWVNGWDEGACLKWLEVRLTEKARNTRKCLGDDVKLHYDTATVALRWRFEPESRQELYFTKFQTRGHVSNETWAELANNLRLLVSKAFPDLSDDTREQLALDHFLSLLDQPELSSRVRQRHPKTINDGLSYTLETGVPPTSNQDEHVLRSKY